MRDGAEPTDTALRKLRIVADDDDGVPRLTVTGVLLCTKEPQHWMPHAQIQAVSYAGDRRDVKYQTDARDVGGPLDAQVREAVHFVRRNMLVQATKTTARMEYAQFSERAIFEALVNAVAHRDYSMAGARVRLHMFGDRIELYVPGGLANTLTPDSMSLRQYSRNELIVSLLARCPVHADEGLGRSYLMDRRGDGVPIILEESERLSGRAPEYSVIDDSELRLVIWAAAAPATTPADEQ
jgi:predicted HTH transcriptional regulator